MDETGANRIGKEEERAVVLKNRQGKGKVSDCYIQQYTSMSSCLDVNRNLPFSTLDI